MSLARGKVVMSVGNNEYQDYEGIRLSMSILPKVTYSPYVRMLLAKMVTLNGEERKQYGRLIAMLTS
jgi:hypothetical protein